MSREVVMKSNFENLIHFRRVFLVNRICRLQIGEAFRRADPDKLFCFIKAPENNLDNSRYFDAKFRYAKFRYALLASPRSAILSEFLVDT